MAFVNAETSPAVVLTELTKQINRTKVVPSIVDELRARGDHVGIASTT